MDLSGNPRKGKSNVNNAQRLLYHPLQDSEQSDLRFRYKPCSPRHQVIYFLQNKLNLKGLVNHLLSIDRGEGTSPLQDEPPKPASQPTTSQPTEQESALLHEHDYGQEEPTPPPAKRRKFGLRVRPLTVEAYCERQEVNYSQVIENHPDTDSRLTLFQAFKEDVVTCGMLHKRFMEDDRQVYLMNEYSLLTGHLLPNSFVHFTVRTLEGERVVECSCKAYEDIRCTANRGLPLPDRYEPHAYSMSFLNDDLTCMHARLYREELRDIPSNPTNLQEKLTVGQDDGRKVQLVDSVYPHATTKFSVAADRFAFVHVWFENGNCLVQCQDGMCLAECKRKHRVKKNTGNYLGFKNYQRPDINVLFLFLDS